MGNKASKKASTQSGSTRQVVEQPKGADLAIQQAVEEYEAFYMANRKKQDWR